ncbi:Transcription factor spt8 [Schaereria dolodes]|nr:Transcription factor spt8 [Schaereria dolodes]
MQSFGDDRDFGGSLNGSSENDQDEQMDDLDDGEADADADGEADGDGDGDVENEEDNDDNDDDDEDQEQEQEGSQDQYLHTPSRRQERGPIFPHASSNNNRSTSSRGSTDYGSQPQAAPTSHPNPTVLLTSPSPQQISSASSGASIDIPTVRAEALTAPVYDIVPTIAAPHSTSINAITATPDLRWVFSGGADGYIRKFNWIETANGKVMLTVAQRHPFVDSVTKAGVLTSYWENDEPQTKTVVAVDDGQSLSPVYSLAIQNQGLWLLSGLESGGINLQSVRHDEGKRISCLRKHTSAVSVLNLSQDERSVLSGSWDKTVVDWDLNTGQVKRSFEGSGGQISAIEMRPLSSLSVPEASGDVPQINGTISTDNATKPRAGGILSNGIKHDSQSDLISLENGIANASGSPTDSLFGGNDADGDSLFGDNDEGEPAADAPAGGAFADDDDDEFSRAVANGFQQQENEDADGDVSMIDPGNSSTTSQAHRFLGSTAVSSDPLSNRSTSNSGESPAIPMNGLPRSEELTSTNLKSEINQDVPDTPQTIDSTFLAASFDGTLRVWDRRRPTAVARIVPKNVPPWCMNACWSPDGNFIYAGRRNGTVEEFSLHKALRGVERTFKFPNGSGAVSAVRAMPNGRQLIW